MKHFKLNALTSPISQKDGMTHAVLQSIYNHGESTQNDRSRMSKNERGGTWSNDLLSIVGSRDWTLKREKLTEQTLSLAKRFYEEALSWLIKKGYAKSIEVSVWEEKPNQMGRSVTITLVDGEKFKVPL
ncbi:phage GP46 family protein [Vibrio sp. 404]|uniref:Phage GP46 family protein n=1 Tax=Vibrio marinisediminis TaxID=2758441 RepID=A0A7W2IS14_9VIBR|nr:phage GP46 family protein [Vibrio marinisediminis]MBA5760854.1 phage GP46 family protein [Vibrio marinisediminis]